VRRESRARSRSTFKSLHSVRDSSSRNKRRGFISGGEVVGDTSASRGRRSGTFSSEASRDVQGNDDRGATTALLRMAYEAATVQFDRARCFRGGRYFRRGVLSSSFAPDGEAPRSADIDAAYQYAVSETEDAAPFCPCLIPVPARYDLALSSLSFPFCSPSPSPPPSLSLSLSLSLFLVASFGQRQAEFKISRGIAATGGRTSEGEGG